MRAQFAKAMLVAAVALSLNAASLVQGQPVPQQAWTNTDPSIRTTFVRLAAGVPGVLYEPVSLGPKSQIAVFAMHSAADYTAFSACLELAKRGYRVLCANNSTSKSGAFDEGGLDRVMLDAKAGVAWLRTVPGVQKIVLWGHSGGATVMTAYQMVAEGGAKACQGREKIWQCSESLAGLPPADGIVLADPNWGLATMSLFSIDPAVSGASSRSATSRHDGCNRGRSLRRTLRRFGPRHRQWRCL